MNVHRKDLARVLLPGQCLRTVNILRKADICTHNTPTGMNRRYDGEDI
jgi:hypothetical protein